MRMNLLPAIAASALGLTGCSVYREATSTHLPTDMRWELIATADDAARLRHWRKDWDAALPDARTANAAAIAGDPLLFDPDRALPDPTPPAGDYRCRTLKLGSIHPQVAGFTANPPYACRIADEGQVKRLVKLDSPQRPTGLIYPDAKSRAVFLGTLVLGDETAPLRYGLDARRDMIGYVERIETRRWRLVLPSPHFESKLDVIELVPAG
ncbi:DUF4893 domain-containing protein [Sphingomonas sp. MMS12-HWE2-04]|uniref:DUF4893 domain-containing protein n=1 Tax=Sphingomonas sp. MMS12-HWE2-04 TaxID=3234199 RepID=UPI00384E3881